MKKILLASTLALGCASLPAMAQDDNPGGSLAPGALFDMADTNSDGALDAGEMKTVAQVLAEKRLGAAPAQTEERLEAGIERVLKRFDVDGDGLLSRNEARNMSVARADRQRDLERKKPWIGKNNRPAPGEIFDRIDANDDGQLSSDEMIGARVSQAQARAKKIVEEIFARYDANKDGALSREETQAMAADMKAGRDRKSARFGKRDRGRGEMLHERLEHPLPFLVD